MASLAYATRPRVEKGHAIRALQIPSVEHLGLEEDVGRQCDAEEESRALQRAILFSSLWSL